MDSPSASIRRQRRCKWRAANEGRAADAPSVLPATALDKPWIRGRVRPPPTGDHPPRARVPLLAARSGQGARSLADANSVLIVTSHLKCHSPGATALCTFRKEEQCLIVPQLAFRRKSVISRRGLLATGAGAGGALLLAGAGRRSVVGAEATPAAGHESHAEANGGAGLFQPAKWESAELVEPEVRRSVDGELATELRVHYAYAESAGIASPYAPTRERSLDRRCGCSRATSSASA